jgi:hypothetical protein
MDERCAAGTDVVVCISHGAEKAFEEVQTDRDVDVNSGVQGGGWEVQHDADYEAEEGKDVLDYEELVPEVANWG